MTHRSTCRLRVVDAGRPSVVDFAPAEHPEMVISVMIENGEAGGQVAGPVVRQIMDAWLLDQHGHLKAQYATPGKKPGNPHV